MKTSPLFKATLWQSIKSDMKQYKEVIPLVGVMGGAIVGVAGFCVYSYASIMQTRGAVNRDSPPHELIRSGPPPQKLYLSEEEKKLRNNPTLEELRKELGSYKWGK